MEPAALRREHEVGAALATLGDKPQWSMPLNGVNACCFTAHGLRG